MKKSIIFILLFFVAIGQSLFGQEENGLYDQYHSLGKEKVFVSLNTSLLFSGEYLYYKVYVLNDKTKQPSNISSIAYVELISEDQDVVFDHKIRLRKSQGQGDFFVPTSLPSGNYKLIAYTRWMRNGSMALFYQEDISIVNPYQANQKPILPPLSTDLTANKKLETPVLTQDNRFVLSTDKKEYAKKSKVTLTLQNFRGASGYGNYNISVRKKEDLKQYIKHTPESYMLWHDNQKTTASTTYKKISFAPELNGELITGKLIAKTNTMSVANKKIGISIPGEDYQLKVVRTDSSGTFYGSITKDYTQPYALFQVLEDKGETYDIEITKDPPLDYSPLQFHKYYINDNMKEVIVQKSLHNQIENGFFSAKPDTLNLDQLNDPYGGAYVETVNLEEYTRFKTLGETIVELVENVWTKKLKDGRTVFKVRSFDETYEESEYDALVFIDGVLMPYQSELLEFDTRKVSRINTVREKYFLGGSYYFGMVHIETIDGNYYEELNDSRVVTTTLSEPKQKKAYFNQSYTDGIETRVPDFRNQLLWKPTISFEGRTATISFYTSEVTGTYEISLEGFSIYGRPVVIKEYFMVD